MSVVLPGAWIAQLLTAAGVIALLAALAVFAPLAWRLACERLAAVATGDRASTELAPLPIAWATAPTLPRRVPLAVVAPARACRAPPGVRLADRAPVPAGLPVPPRARALIRRVDDGGRSDLQ